MRSIVTDRVAWSVGGFVCLSVTLVNPAKTTELIQMPFGLWAQMGPRNHVLAGGPQMLRDVAMATNFWLSMGYNFGCMIASDMLIDTRGGFSGSSYPMKT